MRFLVAPDSFKGTFSAGEVAEAVAAGVERAGAGADRCPAADGGEGTAAVLAAALGEVTRVEVLCDVDAHFEEAAALFAPQKGADAAAVGRLSARLGAIAAQLPRDPRGVAMSGCAGGLSGGLWAHGARLRPGAAFVLDAVGFGDRLGTADAVISGEGRFDSQSLGGKIVGEIARGCAAAGKPLHLIVGADAADTERPTALASLARAETLEEMKRKAFELAISTSRSF